MRVLCYVTLVLTVLLSSALAGPEVYEDHDEEKNAWPISATRKYLHRRYENENKYQGANTEEAIIARHIPQSFNCYLDPSCRFPTDPDYCCINSAYYFQWRGRCCRCFGHCPRE